MEEEVFHKDLRSPVKIGALLGTKRLPRPLASGVASENPGAVVGWIKGGGATPRSGRVSVLLRFRPRVGRWRAAPGIPRGTEG